MKYAKLLKRVYKGDSLVFLAETHPSLLPSISKSLLSENGLGGDDMDAGYVALLCTLGSGIDMVRTSASWSLAVAQKALDKDSKLACESFCPTVLWDHCTLRASKIC